MLILDAAKNGLQLGEHSLWIIGALGQEIFSGDFRFLDPAHVLDANLNFSLKEGRLPTHSDEIIFVEAARQVIGALPHPRFDFAAAIEQLERQVAAAALSDPLVL